MRADVFFKHARSVVVLCCAVLTTSACAITRDIQPLQAPRNMVPLENLEQHL